MENQGGRRLGAEQRRKLVQIVICVICVVVTFRYTLYLEPTEFSGGRITRPLLEIYHAGNVAFFLAGVLTFVLRRTSAALMILGTLLCLPLYLYFTAPGPFRRLFPGEYSVPLQANFEWHTLTILGLLALLISVLGAFWVLHLRPQDPSWH
jgi:hypothetical protein